MIKPGLNPLWTRHASDRKRCNLHTYTKINEPHQFTSNRSNELNIHDFLKNQKERPWTLQFGYDQFDADQNNARAYESEKPKYPISIILCGLSVRVIYFQPGFIWV